jgi:hypothetical protein
MEKTCVTFTFVICKEFCELHQHGQGGRHCGGY